MPRFSVIVPTRERADTLRSALRTLVTQDGADCEFLVSDNASTDDTAAVAASVADSRVRYLRTPARVSMRENWEFALAHARGDYVTIVGDDDGLVPGALAGLSRLIDSHAPQAISWQHASYYWPNYSIERSRNRLHLRRDDAVLRLDAKRVLAEARFGTIHWRYFPVIYGGLIRREVMERVKAHAGHYFGSEIPDVYSGLAALSQLDDYLFTGQPFSVLGFSAKSNASTQWGRSAGIRTGVVREFGELFQGESRLPPHTDFPLTDVMSNTAYITECLFRVRDDLLGDRYRIPIHRLLYRITVEVNRLPEPARSDAIRRLRPIAARHGYEWLLGLTTFAVRARRRILSARSLGRTPDSAASPDPGMLDGARHGLRDIEGACALVGRLQPVPLEMPEPRSITMAELSRYVRGQGSAGRRAATAAV